MNCSVVQVSLSIMYVLLPSDSLSISFCFNKDYFSQEDGVRQVLEEMNSIYNDVRVTLEYV